MLKTESTPRYKTRFFLKCAVAILLVLVALPATTLASKINAGFVSGIWYSQIPFYSGDQIRIYASLHNQTDFDITGTVFFFDNDQVIGQSEFSVLRGRLVETWTDWRVTEGEHTIQARISQAYKNEIGKNPVEIELGSMNSNKDDIIVENDTDSDGLGDSDDDDDDGDGLTDEQEERLSTNSLRADTDGDGVNDGTENRLNTDPLDNQDIPTAEQIQNLSLSEQATNNESQSLVMEVNKNNQNVSDERSENSEQNLTIKILETAGNITEKTKAVSKIIRSNLKQKITGIDETSADDPTATENTSEEKQQNNQQTDDGYAGQIIINTIIYILEHGWLFWSIIAMLVFFFIKLALKLKQRN